MASQLDARARCLGVAKEVREALLGDPVDRKLGILVDIESAYTQCSKAFLRSELWNPQRFVERAALPSAGQIHKEIQGAGFDADKYDEERAARYARREGMY